MVHLTRSGTSMSRAEMAPTISFVISICHPYSGTPAIYFHAFNNLREFPSGDNQTGSHLWHSARTLVFWNHAFPTPGLLLSWVINYPLPSLWVSQRLVCFRPLFNSSCQTFSNSCRTNVWIVHEQCRSVVLSLHAASIESDIHVYSSSWENFAF